MKFEQYDKTFKQYQTILLANQMCYYRAKANLTRSRVAKCARVSYSYLKQIENGVIPKKMMLDQLERICELYHITLFELF